MSTQVRSTLLSIGLLIPVIALSASNGQLPLYPNGRNMNSDMPSLPGMAIPMVLETADSVQKVDAWYGDNTPKSCARTAASGGIKYKCPSGSIMIYAHAGKTQIAFVPAAAGG